MSLDSTRSRAALLAALRDGARGTFVYFWGHQRADDGRLTASCLSQWYPAPFTVAGARYATAEHWMMAAKARLFGDAEALASILSTEDPRRAKALGRGVRGYVNTAWAAARFAAVVEGSVHKFSSAPALRDFLLGTGEAVLVEASPFDRVWGVGLGRAQAQALGPERWRGENLLGFALMEARARLAAPRPPSAS